MGRYLCQGMTLVELMIVTAIIAIIGSLSMSFYKDYTKDAEISRTIDEIRAIELVVSSYHQNHHRYPPTLAAVGIDYKDPWGNDYQYLDIADGGTQTRKDKNLVPINTDYDLYSMGPDGKSALPLTAAASRDDIVRANNGKFVGPADEY